MTSPRTDSRLLTDRELDALATYNAECARGIVHTREWVEAMTWLQDLFDSRDDDNWCSSHRQSRGLCRRTRGQAIGACIVNGPKP